MAVWREVEHPRDTHGRFITKGMLVKLFGGMTGIVDGFVQSGTSVRVVVRRLADNHTATMQGDRIEVLPPPPGSVYLSDGSTARMGDSVRDVDTGAVSQIRSINDNGSVTVSVSGRGLGNRENIDPGSLTRESGVGGVPSAPNAPAATPAAIPNAPETPAAPTPSSRPGAPTYVTRDDRLSLGPEVTTGYGTERPVIHPALGVIGTISSSGANIDTPIPGSRLVTRREGTAWRGRLIDRSRRDGESYRDHQRRTETVYYSGTGTGNAARKNAMQDLLRKYAEQNNLQYVQYVAPNAPNQPHTRLTPEARAASRDGRSILDAPSTPAAPPAAAEPASQAVPDLPYSPGAPSGRPASTHDRARPAAHRSDRTTPQPTPDVASPTPTPEVNPNTLSADGRPVNPRDRITINGQNGTVRSVRPGTGVLIYDGDDGRPHSARVNRVRHVQATEQDRQDMINRISQSDAPVPPSTPADPARLTNAAPGTAHTDIQTSEDLPVPDSPPIEPPSIDAFLNMTRNAPRDEALDRMTEEQLRALLPQLREEERRLAPNGRARMRLGNNGRMTRLDRLETAISQRLQAIEDARTPQSSEPGPPFSDRGVLTYIGNENFGTDELAQIFNVPQSSMLAALRRLENEGYIARHSGNDEGSSISGGRRRMTSLGWESIAGRDGNHDAVVARYDAAHPNGQQDPEPPRPAPTANQPEAVAPTAPLSPAAMQFSGWGDRAEEIASSRGPNISTIRQDLQDDRAQVIRQLEEMYNGPDGQGLGSEHAKVEISTVRSYTGGTVFAGNILLDGARIGGFTRTIHFDRSGKASEIHNDLFTIDRTHQGSGIAKDLYRRQENWAIQQGVPKITIHANIDVGGYAWARAGYDFQSRRGARDLLDTISYRATTSLRPLNLTPDQQREIADQLRDWSRRAATPDQPIPTPFEISRLGWTEGATDWAGKRLMLGTSWMAVKKLRPPAGSGRGRRATPNANAPSLENAPNVGDRITAGRFEGHVISVRPSGILIYEEDNGQRHSAQVARVRTIETPTPTPASSQPAPSAPSEPLPPGTRVRANRSTAEGTPEEVWHGEGEVILDSGGITVIRDDSMGRHAVLSRDVERVQPAVQRAPVVDVRAVQNLPRALWDQLTPGTRVVTTRTGRRGAIDQAPSGPGDVTIVRRDDTGETMVAVPNNIVLESNVPDNVPAGSDETNAAAPSPYAAPPGIPLPPDVPDPTANMPRYEPPTDFSAWGDRAAEIQNAPDVNVNDLWTSANSAVGLQQRQDVMRQLSEIYTADGLGRDKQYKLIVSSVQTSGAEGTVGRRLRYSGTLRNADGLSVGTIERSIRWDDPNNPTHPTEVHNDYLSINSRFQGQGIAQDIYRRQENWFIKQGVDKITIHANIDVGGYAWARAGFDYQNREQAQFHISSIDTRLRYGGAGLTDEEKTIAQEFLDRIKQRMEQNPTWFPTPFELSRIGWTEGAQTWAGKKLLLGTDWMAVKHLRPSNPRDRSGDVPHAPRIPADNTPVGGPDQVGPSVVRPARAHNVNAVGEVIDAIAPEASIAQSSRTSDISIEVPYNLAPSAARRRLSTILDALHASGYSDAYIDGDYSIVIPAPRQ